MRHEGHSYYIGLLSAAQLHGATHQAVMEFQVVTDKRIPKIHAGRSILSFVYRRDMESIANALVDHKTDTGRMKISAPELTALDLIRYAHVAGTIDSQAEERMFAKLEDPAFLADVRPLLSAEEAKKFDDNAAREAFRLVFSTFITRIPGKAWKKSNDLAEQHQMPDLVED
jgi:hypothetical protein